MIAIVNTGGANLASIQNAFRRLGRTSIVTLNKEEIQNSSYVILPGVGHAGYAMTKLREANLDSFLLHLKQPVLAICLGMQILFEFSEEGNTTCLGIRPGHVTRLQATKDFCVPHMGWNQLKKTKKSLLLSGVEENDSVYFVHTYRVPETSDITAVTADCYQIPSVLEYQNFYGVQFHPERSGKVGEKILKNFLERNDDFISSY